MAQNDRDRPRTEALVLRDAEGRYYAVPLPLIEQLRVPAGRTPELDSAFADDTTGFGCRWTVRSGFTVEIGASVDGPAGAASIRVTLQDSSR